MKKDNVNAYQKQYNLRIAIAGRKSIEVTFPYEVVEREARKQNLTVKQFLEQYTAVAHYNGIEGVHYTFKLKGGNNEDSD